MLKIDRTNRHGAFLTMDDCNGIYKGGFLSLINPLVIEALSSKGKENKPDPLPPPIKVEKATEEVSKPLIIKKSKGRRK